MVLPPPRVPPRLPQPRCPAQQLEKGTRTEPPLLPAAPGPGTGVREAEGGGGSQPTQAWPTQPSAVTGPWTPGQLRGTSLGGPGYLRLLWPGPRQGTDWRHCRHLPSGHRCSQQLPALCMRSSKTWTLWAGGRVPSGRLEMRSAPQVSPESSLSGPCLFPSLPLPSATPTHFLFCFISLPLPGSAYCPGPSVCSNKGFLDPD